MRIEGISSVNPISPSPSHPPGKHIPSQGSTGKTIKTLEVDGLHTVIEFRDGVSTTEDILGEVSCLISNLRHSLDKLGEEDDGNDLINENIESIQQQLSDIGVIGHYIRVVV